MINITGGFIEESLHKQTVVCIGSGHSALGCKVILDEGIRWVKAVEEKFGEYMWTKSISNES